MYTEEQIRIMAHYYWDFDVMPPQDAILQVAKYIEEHPHEFRGAKPQ